MADRAQIAASGRYLVTGTRHAGLIPTPWGNALDIPSDWVTSATLTGPSEAANVYENLGIIRPLRGDDMVILSTGIAGAAQAEPGHDFAPLGADGDAVELRLVIDVPAEATKLSLQYNFLSSESPEFINQSFNDAFSIELVDSTGSRPFTLASVDDSKFFDVSDSRAKNTGFDLYTENPAGVDTQFGSGLPDAGLTDFQSFTADVRGGEPLTLIFRISDAGDGILDSAVLIDAVQFSSIETIDPYPDLLDGADISTDPAVLAAAGKPVRGAIADGSTDVLLRFKVPGPGTVDFAVTGAGNGDLSTIGGAQHAGTVAVTAVDAGGGAYYALALYRSPADFNNGGDADARSERTITITADYDADAGTDFPSSIEFQIRRPPLVVTHGPWLDQFQWGLSSLTKDQRFAITYTDWKYACDQELRITLTATGTCPWVRDVNAPTRCETTRIRKLGEATDEAIDNVRRLNLAATKVDVLAHGPGGVYARQYIASDAFRHEKRDRNLGDINRLITVNTPHYGSALGTAIRAARNNTPTASLDQFLCDARIGSRAPVEAGDLDELGRGVTPLPATPVPSHAIVGTGGSLLDKVTALAKIAPKTRLYTNVPIRHPSRTQIFPGAGLTTGVFGANDHDLFVEVDSQRGGLPVGAVTELPMTTATPNNNNAEAYSDSEQFTTIRHPGTVEEIVDLLNSPIASATFAPFPATPTSLAPLALAPPPPSLNNLAGSLTITAPPDGTAVTAGELVTIDLDVQGFDPVAILVLVGSTAEIIFNAPWTTEIKIPRDGIGPMPVLAIGINPIGDDIISNEIVLDVTSLAMLESVQILTRDPVLQSPGLRRSITVAGHYDDGTARDITAFAGTTYHTSNAGVFTVTADGTITAVGPGIATLVARNGARQDSITVTVKANGKPIAVAGADIELSCVAPGTPVSVELSAAGSSDPDGDAITYAWSEGGVALATGPNPTVSLAAGSHTIDLVVTDEYGNWSQDSVAISIGADTAAPSLAILGANPLSLECRATIKDPGATALDACDGDLTGAITTENLVNPNVPGSYAIHYRVSDAAGNPASASRAVVVADHLPPQVSIAPMRQLLPVLLPNFRGYETFTLADCAAASDVCTDKLAINSAGRILAIHSDEADVRYPLDPANDIVLLGQSRFKLRRQSNLLGNGRVYEVVFEVRDAAGNSSGPRSCLFGVKAALWSGTPVYDSRVYTVTP